MDVSSALTSFALVAAVLTITPGLDTALVLRSSLTQGKRHAAATAGGVIAGAFIWGAAASVGISALLTASHLAYTGLKIAGALYMIWLGLSMITKTLRRRLGKRAGDGAGPAGTVDGQEAEVAVARTDRPLRCWMRGLTTNLLNPKVGVFYVAMLPQFIPAGAPHLPMGLALALVHALESVVWFAAIAYGTSLVRGWLQRGSVQRAIDRVTGVVLVGFGVNLVLSE